MDIYVLIHENYFYNRDEYGTKVIVFDSEEGAKTYLEILKDAIKEDIARTYNYDSFEEMFNDEAFTTDVYISENDIRMFLEIEEDGFDHVYIQKQNIMNFN